MDRSLFATKLVKKGVTAERKSPLLCGSTWRLVARCGPHPVSRGGAPVARRGAAERVDGCHASLASAMEARSAAAATKFGGRVCRVGPGNFTLSRSQIPDVNLSIHPARAIA